MADRGVRRVGRPRGAIAIPITALALVLAVSFALWTRGDLNPLICDGDCGPAYVTAPVALTPASVPASEPEDPAPRGSIDAAKVQTATAGTLGDDALGKHVGLVIVGATGELLASQGSGTFIPASTAKLLTGFAALSAVGPQERFKTSVVLAGKQLVLVGGGDPYLLTKMPKRPDRAFRADLTTLAARTAAALKRDGVKAVSLGYDASLFSGSAASSGWDSTYITGNIVTSVSALWTDQGVVNGIRSGDPAASAARIFAGLLKARGVSVAGDPAAASPPTEATPVAALESATVAQIVETLVRTSDNQAAEVMLRHVAIATGKPATFDGGADAITEVLNRAGIETTGLKLRDGSGLSRENRVSPTTLVQTIRAAIAGPQTSTLVSDLPVSGFSGTLLRRFASSKGAYGLVRAKTGTLTGVHSLAGYATDADGQPMIFALMSDGNTSVSTVTAEAALDRVAAAIAGCRCS